MEFKTEALEFLDIRLIDGDRGKNYPKSHDLSSDGDCLFLSAKNVTRNGFAFSEKMFITKEKDAQLRAGKVQNGDIVVTTRGTVGNIAFYDETVPFPDVRINSGMMIFRADLKRWNRKFLYFLMTSEYIKQQIDSLTSGSAVPQLPAKDLKKFQLPCIPINTQNAISEQIGAITDKINLNNRTNQTLEQMAQALFKSWFVDFDPVFDNLLASVDFNLENLETSLPDELKQKAQRRLAALNSLENAAEIKASLSALAHELQALSQTKEATQPAVQAAETPVKANLNANPNILAQHSNTHSHFPNEFEHNEQLGWIPKDWEASKLKEFGKIITGKTPPKKIDDAFDLEGKGVPFITPSDVEGDVFTVNAIRHLTESGVGSVKNNIVDAESVCVTCIGSQMGKTTIAPDKSVTNQQLNSIVLGKKYFRNYIFLNLRMRREELFNLGSSGSTMPILNKTSFENLSVLKPNESSLKAFDDITESCLAKILLNSQNNTKLTTMRDTLLPKLISGELQIPDVTIDKEIVD